MCNGLAAICNANFDRDSDPNIPSCGVPGPPSNTQCYLGPHECPCQVASHSVQRFQQGV